MPELRDNPGGEEHLEAVKIAGEWTKQLGLWATGTIVLSLGFIKDFLAGGTIGTGWRWGLVASWVLLILSLVAGHLAFGAPLTGAGEVGWHLRVNRETRFFSKLQLSFFVLGLLGLVLFVVFNMPRTIALSSGSAQLTGRKQ